MTPAHSHFSGDSNSAVRVEHAFDGEMPPSIAIVQAIAAIENVDPMESPAALGVRLHDHVDPDALDRLVTADGVAAVTVDLHLQNGHEYAVQVRETGQIVVQRPD